MGRLRSRALALAALAMPAALVLGTAAGAQVGSNPLPTLPTTTTSTTAPPSTTTTTSTTAPPTPTTTTPPDSRPPSTLPP
ncbi:MAG: hypothetical protein M3394_01720, partial [Actinomycetota bacterium]|nr:hypothetical protein [Actinomycetota bacterium]